MDWLNFLKDDPVMAWLAFLALMLIVVPAASVLWRRTHGRSQADVVKQPAQVTKETRFGIQSDLIVLFLIVVSVTTGRAEATAQIPDRIVIDGRTAPLFTEPLEDAFRTHKKLWSNLMEHVSIGDCSASRRGYRAIWEVRENALFLAAVHVNPCGGGKLLPLEKLFPGTTGPIKATWFSGTLRVPQGQQIEYVHMGYESRYERYLLLEIVKGELIHRRFISGMPKPVVPNE